MSRIGYPSDEKRRTIELIGSYLKMGKGEFISATILSWFFVVVIFRTFALARW